MEQQYDLVVLPLIVKFVLHREPITFEIDITITCSPLNFLQFHGQKLVVEDEQHLQLRVSLKVLIYFVLYHIFFIVSVLTIPNASWISLLPSV